MCFDWNKAIIVKRRARSNMGNEEETDQELPEDTDEEEELPESEEETEEIA